MTELATVDVLTIDDFALEPMTLNHQQKTTIRIISRCQDQDQDRLTPRGVGQLDADVARGAHASPKRIAISADFGSSVRMKSAYSANAFFASSHRPA